MTRVVLVDDHQMIREGLRALLEKDREFEVVGEAEDGQKALEVVRRISPEVIVMDVAMPRVNGIQATKMIKERFPHIIVLGLSMHADSEFIKGMLASGASGYLLKDSAFHDLAVALRTVLAGKTYLSPQIAGLVVDPFLSQTPGVTERETAEITGDDSEVIRMLMEGNTHNRVGNIPVMDSPAAAASQGEEEGSPGYRETCEFVSESIEKIRAGRPPDMVRGYSIASGISESVEGEDRLLLEATDREQGFSITAHSVNVSILATRVMQVMGTDRKESSKVGLTALLHEVGLPEADEELIYKSGRLTKAELDRVRQRPLHTGAALRRYCPRYPWLAEIVEQVYERADGTGYPKGLSGREISLEGQVLGVVDLLEARIHRRPYRQALGGYESMLDLVSTMKSQWSPPRSQGRPQGLFPLPLQRAGFSQHTGGGAGHRCEQPVRLPSRGDPSV